jgi:hypothetical protein
MQMQILVNTDSHVGAVPDLVEWVRDEISQSLSRFSQRVTRVEVHLSDQNADRGGAADMRCALEARPAGRAPIAVTHTAATVEEACRGAVSKMRNLLDASFGRTKARQGRESIRYLDEILPFGESLVALPTPSSEGKPNVHPI